MLACSILYLYYTGLSNGTIYDCQKKGYPGIWTTFYLTLGCLCPLVFYECLQFISKIRESQVKDYFHGQNICELIMFGLTIALFVTQGQDKDMLFNQNENQNQTWPDFERETNHYYQMQLMGWDLFLAWTNLTIFLGKLDFFERHIHMSRQIFMSVLWSVAVFFPSIVAFASGFHCFLLHDRIFDSFMASILKTIGMLLGEVDIGDHFIHANEETTTEIANPSAQIMLVMFIVYGVLIFMNLLLALVVNKMDPANFWIAEIIPTKQRIQDISSMTDIASLICRWYKPTYFPYHSALVCITTKPKEERSVFFGKFSSKWVLKYHQSGMNRICCEIGKIGKFMRFSPRKQLVKQTIEMIKRKKMEEMDLLKAVKDVQIETEERLHQLVYMADLDYCVWPKRD